MDLLLVQLVFDLVSKLTFRTPLPPGYHRSTDSFQFFRYKALQSDLCLVPEKFQWNLLLLRAVCAFSTFKFSLSCNIAPRTFRCCSACVACLLRIILVCWACDMFSPQLEQEIRSYIKNYRGSKQEVFNKWGDKFLGHIAAQNEAYSLQKEQERLERVRSTMAFCFNNFSSQHHLAQC